MAKKNSQTPARDLDLEAIPEESLLSATYHGYQRPVPDFPLQGRVMQAVDARKISAAELARQADTTEATISNWLRGRVKSDHVKADQLLRICKALRVNPEWLMYGTGDMHAPYYTWADAPVAHDDGTASQPVKLETLTIALRLAAEALDDREHELPLPKRAELTSLLYELLEEGLPEAKVLKFARAAAA